jgi:hypothetical protein
LLVIAPLWAQFPEPLVVLMLAVIHNVHGHPNDHHGFCAHQKSRKAGEALAAGTVRNR